MNYLQFCFFLLAGTLYLINRFLLNIVGLEEYTMPYLNDILCLPVALTVALFFQQKVIYKTTAYRLTKMQILFAFIYFAVVFEGILPAFSSRYIRDGWDVLAYAAGGILYYFYINPKATIQSGSSVKPIS